MTKIRGTRQAAADQAADLVRAGKADLGFVMAQKRSEPLFYTELQQVTWCALGHGLARWQARAVAGEHDGVFPNTEAGLLALPGVGAYTAAAVASIAFDRAANVVDGNVERVMARLFAVETPVPAARPELKRLAGLSPKASFFTAHLAPVKPRWPNSWPVMPMHFWQKSLR